MFNTDLVAEDESGTVFRDMLFLALGGFMALVILLLPHIHPEGKKEEEGAPPPGQVTVEIRWPDNLPADVDLWVQAPGDKPVGYSNKGGKFFNLLRDDLGRTNDALELNYENSYTRGIPAGEYTVNVHLYRNDTKNYPVPVDVVVSTRGLSATAKQILASTVDLTHPGEERTVFRFKLKENGMLVPGSVHAVQKKLRVQGTQP